MNDITKSNNASVTPIRPGALDPFQSYGEQTTQRNIVGQLLKFTKGDYVCGENNEEVEEGTQFVAVMDELLIGWIRWSENRPTDHIMGKIAQSYQPPRRNELGDMDKDQWETDATGQLRDPWQFSNYLLLKSLDEHGEGEEGLYTFTTSSRGGLNAIGLLCKKYGGLSRQHPNEWPVIAIGVGSYNHSDFGRIKFPTFEIVGWVPRAVVTEGLAVLPETLGKEDADPVDAIAKAAHKPVKAAAKSAPTAKSKARF